MKEFAKAGAFDRRFLIKIIVMSNISMFMVLFCFFTATAGGSYAQKVKLNLHMNEASLYQVVSEIKNQTAFEFAYDANLETTKIGLVSVKAKDESIDQVLTGIFNGTGLRYRIIDRIILLSKDEITTSLEAVMAYPVTGVVRDKNGPLPGVTVRIKGTTTGTITNTDGLFKIDAEKPEAVLVFSYIGFITKEVVLNGQQHIEVLMDEDVMNLDEVVVMGYGTQRRRDITGAVSTVNSSDIKKIPVAGIDQALQGQSAGVQVTQDYGTPGSSMQIRIRGIGTIGDSDPLYVIDGVPTKEMINSLNTNDIESITVLKDASAAAIYGARAANGVVLINTKKGIPGQTQVQLNAQYGIQQISNKLDLLTADDYAMISDEALVNAGLEPFWAESGAVLGKGTDWQDQIFRNAAFNKYDLSVSAGNAGTSYMLGIGYFGQNGIVKFSDFKRYNLRFNIDSKVNDKLTVGSNMNLSKIDENLIDTEINGVVRAAIFQPPTIPVYDETGNYAGPGENEGDAQNPLGMADRSDKSSGNNQLFGNVFAQYQIIPSLTFKTNVGLNVYSLQTRDFEPTFTEGNANRVINSFSHQDVDYFDVNWENTLDYTKTSGDHKLGVLVGNTMQNSRTEFISGYRENFSNNDEYLQQLDAGSSNDKTRGNLTEWSLLSYFSRVNYEFADKYLVSVNARLDGSSRFGKSNRWGLFPSASVGWRLSNEKFFKVKAIDDLKLRASWGQLGNQDIGLYAFASSMQQVYYTFGIPQVLNVGYYPAADFNPDVKWETTTQTNLGLDLSAFQYRFYFSADYYVKNTTDMLLILPQAATSGFSSTGYENLGEVQNKGLEFVAQWRDNIGKLNYNLGANLSTFKNKVIQLGEYSDAITSGLFFDMSTRTEVGHSIREFYGYVTEGIFQNEAQIEAHADQPGAVPGDIIFKDINKDGVINSDDRTFIGNPYPDLFFGFNAGISWRNFDINLFFQGQTGNEIYNATKFWLTNSGYNYNKGTEILERWTGEGTSNTEPRVSVVDANQNARGSDRYIEDGSYLRLKNLQIGYTLPSEIAHKAGMKNARVYFSGGNLLTFTKYTGYDPEVGVSRAALGDRTIGFDEVTYPQNKSFIFGLNLTF